MHLNSKKFQSITPGKPQSVKVRGGDIFTALRIWKKQQELSNVVQDLFDRKFYKKKSVIRREQLSLAKYNQQKEDLKNEN